ncbi:hypothetical protein ABGI61_01925 [Rheinheimera sp. FR7-31]|uniref:CsbD family protein n=1 Tax=Rheinheimera fenheensis TaxID=3152295 RepID=UPI00325C636A
MALQCITGQYSPVTAVNDDEVSMNKYDEQYRGDPVAKTAKTDAAGKNAQADKGISGDKSAPGAKSVQVTPANAVKTKWPQQVKAAKSQWGKLSEAEILKSEGDPQQLSNLVQQRYAIGRDMADKQVASFLDKCKLA